MTDEQKEILKSNGFDVETTLARFMNKEDLFQKFLIKFIDDNNYAKLKEELNDYQYEDAFLSAHTLKGVAGNLGIKTVYDQSSIVLEKLRKKNYEGIEQDFKDLTRCYDIVIETLNKLFIE